MPLEPINCNEALDAKLTVERVRPHSVLLQVLRSCETLRAYLAHIVPVRLQVLLVVLTRMLLQLVPDEQESEESPYSCVIKLYAPADKAVVAVKFIAGKPVLHHLVLRHPEQTSSSSQKEEHRLCNRKTLFPSTNCHEM